jgi:predicted DNA-binding WGR domain protein
MRHFIYQDEKSHKFWAVEQQGNELHISWGKVGTKGQSQIKSFSDAAAAEKAELKLIAEKVKKGYVDRQPSPCLRRFQSAFYVVPG